jgi:hypothetical protein
MRAILPLLVGVVLAAVTLVLIERLRRRPRPAPAPVTGTMRQRLLAGSAAEFGVTPRGQVWGVLMELGFPGSFASLVALADGSASLYTSTGGGILGAGVHDTVKQAALALCDLAGAKGDLPQVTEFPSPEPGRVRFYILGSGGVRGAEAADADLKTGAHPLAALFGAGHALLTELRLASEKKPG